jgi:tetratricopeptide (TPR) repeat protein
MGLIHLARSLPEPAYEFRHGLVQDAAYASLLKQDRKWLHQTVGELLERVYPDRQGQLAPVLAEHFRQAGDDERALRYFALAADLAARMYALPEAENYYTFAIEISQARARPLPELYRARGSVHETRGDFERALLDYESAIRLAQRGGDSHAEWRALLDLGLLWAGQDYAQTHAYYERALELAQAMDDPGTIAQSLNRMGNWYANVEQPRQALRYHQQALAAFQALDDPHGIAGTLDLLGQTCFLAGDLIPCHEYYGRAINLFEKLGDRRGMVSSLATQSACHTFIAYSVVMPPGTLAGDLRDVQQALSLARQIGWRVGEAEALCVVGACFGAQGRYTEALDSLLAGLALARAIGHRQWTVLAETILGGTYLELLALPEAQQHLEHARSLADEVGSLYWARITAALLAQVYVAQCQLSRATQVLDVAPEPDAPPETIAQRTIWCARAEVALATGTPARVLEITDKLAVPRQDHTGPSAPILQVSRLRGEALVALHRYEEGEIALKEALDTALMVGARPMAWRVLIWLGKAYAGQERSEAAQQAITTARTVLHDIATHTPDGPLRANLLNGATLLMS